MNDLQRESLSLLRDWRGVKGEIPLTHLDSGTILAQVDEGLPYRVWPSGRVFDGQRFINLGAELEAARSEGF